MSNSRTGGEAPGAVSPRATGSVQSVDRALRVLEILADHGARGVTEIADELGVHKSTAFRLMSMLEDHRPARGCDLRSARPDPAEPAGCEDLATELDETVNIAVLQGSSVINISQARGGAAIASHNWVGQLTPPHATSSGKVLLAALPDAQVTALLPDPLQRFTDRTVTTRSKLRQTPREGARWGTA
jgi:IclR family transcriptional regulator, acetate operon repressor